MKQRPHPLTDEKIFRYLLLGKSSVQSIDGYCSINSEHSWQEDDLVIVENHLLVNGRTGIHEQTERELWRVQIY